MTHYEVLGISRDASAAQVREAYRRLARVHHPDRVQAGSAASAASMPAINEAYRVLNDPARRAVYDASLRTSSAPSSESAATARDGAPSGSSGPGPADRRRSEPPYDGPVSIARDLRPGLIPWRMVLGVVAATVAGLVVLSLFTEPGEEPPPDGILRVGDCVEYQSDGDAAEVPCNGVDDLVVRAFVPFDGTCPGLTEPHRDQQGMGIACVASVSADGE